MTPRQNVDAALESTGAHGGRVDRDAIAIAMRTATPKAIEFLGKCLTAPAKARQMSAQVAAAGHLLAMTRWLGEEQDPEEQLVALLGSKARLLEWMERTIPRLRAELAAARGTATRELPARGGREERIDGGEDGIE